MQSVLERELERCGDKLAQARAIAEADAIAAGNCSRVHRGRRIVSGGRRRSRGRLDALADAGVRMVTLTERTERAGQQRHEPRADRLRPLMRGRAGAPRHHR
ncbi:MAG: hypothetical protein ACLTMP_14110 [Eggerthella lenta]